MGLIRVVVSWLILSAACASQARAWTRAHVREVHARLTLEQDAGALIQLDLSVEVEGGWLERLELAGLGQGATSSTAHRPRLQHAEGEVIEPEVRNQDGMLEVRFPRAQAPRRGVHHLRLYLHADLATRARVSPTGQVRLRWGLPAWEAGLTAASIQWLGPRHMQPVVDERVAHEVRRRTGADGLALTFTRLHLPRGLPWEVAVDVPGLALPALHPPAPRPRPAVRPPPRRFASGVWLAAVVFGSALSAQRRVRARHLRAGVRSVRLLARPRATEGLAFGSAVSGAALWPVSLWAALACFMLTALLLVESGRTLSRPLPLGRFRPLARAELQRMGALAGWWRRWLAAVWGERGSLAALTTVLALLAWGAPHGALDVRADPWGLGLACSLLSWIAALSLRAPRSLADRVRHLMVAAGRARALGCGLRLMWYVCPGQRPTAPRLRVFPAVRYAGLLRMEIVVDSRRSAPALGLLIVVEAGSSSERWLRELWPSTDSVRSSRGTRAAYLQPITDVGAALNAVFEHFSRRSQAGLAGRCVQAA